MTKATTIDEYHAGLSDADREICERLRAEIDVALPDAPSKLWHAHPVWFLDGNPIAGYLKLKSGIRLMFWSGQSFSVAGLQPSGSFKAAVVEYADVGQIDAGLLRQWLGEARNIQWDYKNIVKRKGALLPLKQAEGV